MGAEYLFYMKLIETHARAFLALIILPIGTVVSIKLILFYTCSQIGLKLFM
jgi:hypothetical protein